MKKLLFVFAILINTLLASAVNNDFTEKFEKRSIYGKWIDIDKGEIIEVNSKTKFSFERLDNNLIILKRGKSKSYLKRIGALKTRITDHSGVTPAINSAFIKVDENDYWTSTTSNNDKDRAWGISFSKGSDYTFDKTERIFVRCVRDQQ